MSLDNTSSNERLSFTMFLAIAAHVVLLGFVFKLSIEPKPAPTLNVTLATHQSMTEPEKADFLAQFNQEASGTIADTKEITTNQTSEVVAPRINKMAPLPQNRAQHLAAQQEEIVTTQVSTHKIQQQIKPDEEDAQQEIEGQLENVPEVNPEIANLRAKLDRLQQEFARRPRIRYMTSVATAASVDAAYLNRWTQKVELMGNRHFPKAAIDNRIYGSLRISVLINADGTVAKVEVLKPSGHSVLDQAALQIIKLAGPFDPFPPEISINTDQIDIIRTWNFEITGLSTGDSRE